MIIKKFQAKTEEEAISVAKKEMGENVVIMSVRNLKKKGLFSFLKKSMVEITVGMEEESEKPEMSVSAAFSQIAKRSINQGLVRGDVIPDDEEMPAKEDDRSEKVIEQRLDNLQSLLEKQLTKEPKADEFKEEKEEPSVAFLKLIYNTLIENEVAEKYANELLDEIGKISTSKSNVDFLLGNIYQKMILKFGQPVTIPLGPQKQRVIFFIGPTGVGKTTTIAKLASQLCVNHKKKVVLLTTDTYRIAAAEQLKTYAGILEAPFRVIYTEEEMVKAIEDYKDYEYVLVDTAGHSHYNEEQKASMSHFINSIDEDIDKETYLVVSATTKYRDLLAIADAYSEFTDYKLIFTKLDETTSLGNLFNLCMHTGAPMSYVTCGQNVPNDIEVFSPQSTVKQLLGGK